jgi:hypothetical protein
MNRHPSVEAITRFFEYDHLPEPLRFISFACAELSETILGRIDDDPELTAGLRKLLEAKDCFVRAMVAQENKSKSEPREGKPI